MPRELLPAGRYNAVSVPFDTDDGEVSAQLGMSSTGKEQILLHFQILDGPYIGARVPWIGYFSAATWQRTVEALRLCGWTGDMIGELPRAPLNQRVSIVVEHNEYKGKTYPRVQWVNRPGGGGMRLQNAIEPNRLRQFSAQLKTRVRAVPPVAGEAVDLASLPTAPAPAEDGPPPPADDFVPPPQDDDIPF